MAITTVAGTQTVGGAVYEKVVIVTLDASYPNPAGYVLNAATFGFTVLRKLIFSVFTSIAGGAYEVVVIPTNNADGSIGSAALHLVVGATGAEVANAVNLSAVSFMVIAYGT